jgi:hypothetical protein
MRNRGQVRWHLSIVQAGALLGDLPRLSAYKLRSMSKTLGMDQLMTRISYVVGIFNALHILLLDTLADAWMTGRMRIHSSEAGPRLIS